MSRLLRWADSFVGALGLILLMLLCILGTTVVEWRHPRRQSQGERGEP